MKIFDGITRKYLEVMIEEKFGGYYVNNDGEMLYRIETIGKSGRKMYSNKNYIHNGVETKVYGMGGSTGHGWGGRVIGYITRNKATEMDIKI